MSVGKACDDEDIDFATFDKNEARLYKSGKLIATAQRSDGLHELHTQRPDGLYESHQPDKPFESHVATQVPIRIWHERLAHLPIPAIVELVKDQAANGIATQPSKYDLTTA